MVKIIIERIKMVENMDAMADNTKTYAHDYDQYEDEGKSAAALVEEILEDPDLPGLKEIIIGNWGGAWEEDCQALLDGIVENADRFANVERLFVGDMDYEECEVSWIMQGDYSRLWAALPGLKALTIKGSMDLELGEIVHEGLESPFCYNCQRRSLNTTTRKLCIIFTSQRSCSIDSHQPVSLCPTHRRII